MLHIFTLVTGVFGLQLVLCLAACPRELTIEFANFDDTLIVTKNTEWKNKVAKILAENNYGESKVNSGNAIVNDIERQEKSLDNGVIELAVQKPGRPEYVRLQNRLDTIKKELPGRKDTLGKAMVNAGNFVYAPGPPNYIIVPPELLKIFKEIKENGILISYALAKFRPDIDSNTIADQGYMKKITEIEDGKIYCKSLEFKIPEPFNEVVLSLGAVRQGEFYLESEKIEEHDRNTTVEHRIAEQKLSQLFASYRGKPLTPMFDLELKVNEKTQGLTNVTGTITGFSLTTFTDISMPDGKIIRKKFNASSKELNSSDDTLNSITDRQQCHWTREYGRSFSDTNVKYTLTFYYIK